MKLLTISRSKLEIASTQLRKPLLVIGRSPTCDVVLRAPEIKPVHFIIEWVGGGVFDPTKGRWAIVDISSGYESGEGVVLSEDAITYLGLSFQVIDSKLESTDALGGTILESLNQSRPREPDYLEFVQVRTDSGSVEEVLHYPVKQKTSKTSLSREFKSFRIEYPKGKSDVLLDVLLDEMPNAEIMVSGKKVEPRNVLPLRANDFVQVKWNGRDFYLRFVEEVKSPPIPQDFWGDPLLKKLTILIAALTVLAIWTIPRIPEPEIEKELPRVARIEIPATPAPVKPPATPEPPATAEATHEVVEKKPEPPKKSKKDLVQVEKKTETAKAAAPKVVKAPEAKPKEGLNSAAKVSDVNQVGLLGALNKNVKKGPGVKADQILNSGIITDTATAQDHAEVVIKTPPAGVVGTGDGGSPQGSGTKSLGEASTTLSGVAKADPNSIGPIARKGGTSGFTIGTSASGSAGTSGSTGNGLGTLDSGDFSVAGGGLDRETVRRIIASYRGQIRTCYERALIANPKIEGRVVYQWKISAEGAVVTVEIKNATIPSDSLKTCVLDVIHAMDFPKAPNHLSTTVIYPFVFQGKK